MREYQVFSSFGGVDANIVSGRGGFIYSATNCLAPGVPLLWRGIPGIRNLPLIFGNYVLGGNVVVCDRIGTNVIPLPWRGENLGLCCLASP